MKTIKHISFNEKILIPAKQDFNESSVLWHFKGTINGEKCGGPTTVHVLSFNCEKSEEILSIVESEISLIEDSLNVNSEDKAIIYQKNFFLNLKKEIENQALHHETPKELIDFLSMQGIGGLKKDNLIFLSGVSSIAEE
jgi:hypothetical protein